MSQGKYIKDMIKKFGLNDSKAISTPSGNMVDQKLYRSMIGSLLYVTTSRPDVMFSVCMCARFQASLKESHLKDTKRILRYLKHTQNVGLWYPKGAKFELVGYSDSDYAGCKVERKSTSGNVNYWEDHLFHGHQRSKIVLHYQPPKPNTYPPVVVVHKYFG